ncbi:MAG: hypothetical protein JJV91_02440 [Desulfosarcina sp.]|nr:hypothetical protein [Desulfobacterales bacterium]
MSPSAETVKLVKCLQKLTFKKATGNAGKSDNRQIPAAAVTKTSGGKYTPNEACEKVYNAEVRGSQGFQ